MATTITNSEKAFNTKRSNIYSVACDACGRIGGIVGRKNAEQMAAEHVCSPITCIDCNNTITRRTAIGSLGQTVAFWVDAAGDHVCRRDGMRVWSHRKSWAE